MAIDPDLRIASVQLAVSDLERSIDFYGRVLGLPLIDRSEELAVIGADVQHPSLLLHPLAVATRIDARSTGLFHVAWLHPTRAALADTVRRIVQGGWRFDGASDHGVSEALYLSDPDGLGIEIYVDRPREQWARPANGQGVEMVTLALDIDDLLAQGGEVPAAKVATGTVVGHVHMKVADVARSNDFYRDTLGFEEQAMLPSAAFLSAGGYHHHIGLNSWQSRGSAPAPETAPGLREVVFELGTPQAVKDLQQALKGFSSLTAGPRDSLSVRDPDGQLLSFAAAPQR